MDPTGEPPGKRARVAGDAPATSSAMAAAAAAAAAAAVSVHQPLGSTAGSYAPPVSLGGGNLPPVSLPGSMAALGGGLSMNGGDGLGSLDLSGMGGGDFSSGPRMSLMGGSNGQMGALPPASSAAAAVAAAAAAGHGSASRAMPGGNGVPPPPGGPARSDGSAEQRRYAIQQQLMLLIHAYKCKLPVAEEAKPGEPYCQVRFCSIMKKVLQHMSKCQLGRKCNEPHCGSSRQIIAHYSSCKTANCPICAPLRKQKAASTSGSFGGGAVAAHTAAAMGGLGGASVGGAGGAGAMSSAVVKREGAEPIALPSQQAYRADDWRSKVAPSQRQKLTSKVIEQLTACVSPADQKEKAAQIRNLGTKIEENVWRTATQQDDYYHLLAEKIYKLKKAHESRRAAPRPGPPSALQIKPEPKVYSKEEMLHHFQGLHQDIYELPEAEAFRQPVDVKALGLTDYYDIIKRPMDLSTIGSKLQQGVYRDPWEYCDDMRLMVDNAHTYNKKNSPVYKNASKLLSTWEEKIELIMKRMGFCCGERRTFNPKTLYCYSKTTHVIPYESKYMLRPSDTNGELGISFCLKCYKEQKRGSTVFVDDTGSGESGEFPAKEFRETINNHIELEAFTRCGICSRKFHQICVMWHKQLGTPFICQMCNKDNRIQLPPNKFTSEKLPETTLGTFLQTKLNKYLDQQRDRIDPVVVRVVNIRNKTFGANKETLEFYQAKGEPFPNELTYRSKALFVFQKQGGQKRQAHDVCFFGMHVQEYGDDAPPANRRRVYISYLDSVHFFHPSQLRTEVYHVLLLSYLEYVRDMGFHHAHIWACPPSPGDDYIFHCHPESQRTPNTKRLQSWYRKMLDKAKQQRIIDDYVNLDTYIAQEKLVKAYQIPYFEGDFWPNRLEATISDIKNGVPGGEGEGEGGVAGKTAKDAKKGKKSKAKGGSKRGKANAKKGGKRRPTVEDCEFDDDAMSRLMEEVKKHREAFFVVRLKRDLDPGPMPADPDKDIVNELMDGRDQFLTLCRDHNYEFSTPRRAKYSSMMMLYHLHTSEGGDPTYTCNRCQTSLSTMDFRFHCVGGCEDFDMCKDCHSTYGHEHEVRQEGLGMSNAGAISGGSTEAQRRETLNRALVALQHAVTCTTPACKESGCDQIKRMLAHVRTCSIKREQGKSCGQCKPLMVVIYHHARMCKSKTCVIPYCAQYRHTQISRQKNMAAKMQMRRIANMRNVDNAPAAPAASMGAAAAAGQPPHSMAGGVVASGAGPAYPSAAAPALVGDPSGGIAAQFAPQARGSAEGQAVKFQQALRALTPEEMEKYKGATQHLEKTRKALTAISEQPNISAEMAQKLEGLRKVKERLENIQQRMLVQGLTRFRERLQKEQRLKEALLQLLKTKPDQHEAILATQTPEDQQRLRDALQRRERIMQDRQRQQQQQQHDQGYPPQAPGVGNGMPPNLGMSGHPGGGDGGQQPPSSNAARLAEITDSL